MIEKDDPIWEVTLSRTVEQKVYVQCATQAEAREAAEELVSESEWEEQDTDLYCVEITNPPEAYWSGGPEGGYVDV